MRQPIAIVHLSGETYACPGWFSIPDGTTPTDLKKMDFGIKEKSDPVHVQRPNIKKLVDSSNGKSQYTVKFNGMSWSCTCPGYGFRRYCKHIETVKNETK